MTTKSLHPETIALHGGSYRKDEFKQSWSTDASNVEDMKQIFKTVKKVSLVSSKDKLFSLLFYLICAYNIDISIYILFVVNIIDNSNLQILHNAEITKIC